jgi:hypothetical protein
MKESKVAISLVDSDRTRAVAYIARGADRDSYASFERFLDSYSRNPAGVAHTLYVIFKGFGNSADLERAQSLFAAVPHQPVFLGDDKLDIGAYMEWAALVREKQICVFNTTSKILTRDWLRKLAVNLAIPNVGLVGATASFESLREMDGSFPLFPNIHLRSTAFMMDRELFLDVTRGRAIGSKLDAYHFESGHESLTRLVLAKGKEVLLVGRNGRGYSPKFWASSDTFRQGTQFNLLVADKHTEDFMRMPWATKRDFAVRTWGRYIESPLLFPA